MKHVKICASCYTKHQPRLVWVSGVWQTRQAPCGWCGKRAILDYGVRNEGTLFDAET